MQRSRCITSLFLLFFFAACQSRPAKNDLGSAAAEKQIFIASDWHAQPVTRAAERKGNEIRFFELQAGSSERDVVSLELVEPLDRARAESIARTKLQILQNLYEEQASPYPGEVSKSWACPQALKCKRLAVANKNLVGSAILVCRASQRLQWGYCQQDQPAKIGASGFFYDSARKRLLRADFFQAEKSYDRARTERFFKELSFQ